MEIILRHAAEHGNCDRVRVLLEDCLNLDVNKTWEGEGHTALFLGCSMGHADIVSMLLALPQVNVNAGDIYGTTPLMIACDHGASEIVDLLLGDPRLDASRCDQGGCTALWHAAFNGHLDVIKVLIASARDLDLDGLGWYDDIGRNVCACEVSRRRGHSASAILLHCFKVLPAIYRFVVQVELGFPGASAAFFFALVVFLCDAYLMLIDDRSLAGRFFTISQRLPIELQMTLSLRVFGLENTVVPKADSELGFRAAADFFL